MFLLDKEGVTDAVWGEMGSRDDDGERNIAHPRR